MKIKFLILAFFLLLPVASAEAQICACYSTQDTCQEVTAEDDSECADNCESQLRGEFLTYEFSNVYGEELTVSDECALQQQTAEAGATTATATATPTSRPSIVPVLNVEIPGVSFSQILEDNGYIEVNFLAEYISGLYKYLLAISAIFAVVMIMIGGIQYILSPGGKGRERINNAVIGMVLLFSVYIILYTVNPGTTAFSAFRLIKVPYVFVSTENTGADVSALGLPAPSTTGTNGVPYYTQRNYPDDVYGQNCEGNPTIKTSGCGPTSAAMVLSYYNVKYDPKQVATTFDSEGYRICGSGTSYSAFVSSALIKRNNLSGEIIPISNHSEILGHLRNKEPIIISVGPGSFTRSGHFMVLTGVNSDSSIALNDPNSGKQSISESELWETIKFAVYIHPN